MVVGICNEDLYATSVGTYSAFQDNGICEEWGTEQIKVCGFCDKSVFEFAQKHDIFPRKLIHRDIMYEEYYQTKKEILYSLDNEIKESFDKVLNLLRENSGDEFAFSQSPLFWISAETKIWGNTTPLDVWVQEKNNKKADGQP